MTKSEAMQFFGNNNQIAKAAGVNRSTVGRWSDIPIKYRHALYKAAANRGVVKNASRGRK